MAYTALYRKLRPQSFAEVVGQEQIIKTLTNQLETGRITHAYLFCGVRGTGKTSTAKIFARAVNCTGDTASRPCNKCESCQAINANASLNIIEIDAASNNGVDNIREIRDEVKYPPTNGRYKVYIIDEVHMLSIGAFNALLKTLEEPPSHVIFILATTDPQKIPVTILSRCQRFDFKRISKQNIMAVMEKFSKEENIDVDYDALEYIAKISDGALRDALSILDQCISYYYNEKITLEKALEISGSVDSACFFKITDALLELDSGKCMEIIREITENGRDINQFVSELLQHLRNVIVAGSVGTETDAVDMSAENRQMLAEQYSRAGRELIIKLISVFADLYSKLKYAFDARLQLEIACIRICSAVDEKSYEDLFLKIKSLENAVANGIMVGTQKNTESEKKTALAPNAEKPKKKLDKSLPEDILKVIENWGMVVARFSGVEQSFLKNAEIKSFDGKILYIVVNKDIVVKRLMEKKDKINAEINSLFNKEYSIMPISESDYRLKSGESLNENEPDIEQELKIIEGNIEYIN